MQQPKLSSDKCNCKKKTCDELDENDFHDSKPLLFIIYCYLLRQANNAAYIFVKHLLTLVDLNIYINIVDRNSCCTHTHNVVNHKKTSEYIVIFTKIRNAQLYCNAFVHSVWGIF